MGIRLCSPLTPKRGAEHAGLIGKTGQEAVQAIVAATPGVNAVVVPEGSMVTMDYREDRVRVFVSEEGKVVRISRG
jgi:hypothetical protein